MSVARIASGHEISTLPAPNGLTSRTRWKIDPTASRVEFTIRKRLFVAPLTVTGRFTDVEGEIALDELNPTTAEAVITIGATSIDTSNPRRDTHLRKADFFDVDTHPAITFHSRRVELLDQAAARYRVVGDLQVRGVSREVSLEAHYIAPDTSGPSPRMKLTLATDLNRRDFGMLWNTLFISVAGELTVNLDIGARPA